jgi:hypothetical protein
MANDSTPTTSDLAKHVFELGNTLNRAAVEQITTPFPTRESLAGTSSAIADAQAALRDFASGKPMRALIVGMTAGELKERLAMGSLECYSDVGGNTVIRKVEAGDEIRAKQHAERERRNAERMKQADDLRREVHALRIAQNRCLDNGECLLETDHEGECCVTRVAADRRALALFASIDRTNGHEEPGDPILRRRPDPDEQSGGDWYEERCE